MTGDTTPPCAPARTMRFSGKLSTWQDERGFGFITLAGSGEEVFVHIKAFARDGRRPQLGERLDFELACGPQGRKRALRVRRVDRVAPSARRRPHRCGAPRHRMNALLAPGALLGLYALYALSRAQRDVPWPIALACLVGLALSLLSFALYAVDKRAAVSARRRVPESTLQLLSLAGGWPGAWLAQRWLHHKRAKAAFMRTFRLAVAAHLAMLLAVAAWWLKRGAA